MKNKKHRKSFFKHSPIYFKKGDLIGSFLTVNEAAKSLNIWSQGIYKCCSGKLKCYSGYVWSFKPFKEEKNEIGIEWRDIIGFEGLYQVSNDGKVRTCHYGFWKILTDCVTKYGYKSVLLHDGKGGRKNARVHRLVAEAFIPNPNNYPYINHKDENKQNNNVNNLEWCTAKYNSNYGTNIERIKNNQLKTPILMYSLNGELIQRFESVSIAEKQTGYAHGSICRCCQGKLQTFKGYIWIYENQKDKIEERIKNKNSKSFYKIEMYDLNNNLIKTFNSVCEASRVSGIPRKQIDNQIHKNIFTKNNKFIWKLK